MAVWVNTEWTKLVMFFHIDIEVLLLIHLHRYYTKFGQNTLLTTKRFKLGLVINVTTTRFKHIPFPMCVVGKKTPPKSTNHNNGGRRYWFLKQCDKEHIRSKTEQEYITNIYSGTSNGQDNIFPFGVSINKITKVSQVNESPLITQYLDKITIYRLRLQEICRKYTLPISHQMLIS